MDQKQYLTDILQQQNIVLSDRQTEQLLLFYDLLAAKNRVMNLTTITDFQEVCLKHFADSLSLYRLAEKGILTGEELSDGALKLIDVGCGAGFPGLVLAVACPGMQVTLLDSLQKRVGFLSEVIEKLELVNCKALHGRAEDLARQKEYRQTYDLAVSRAVANLSTLSEYCLPFVKEGGLFVAYKAARIKEEAPAAAEAVRLLGGVYETEIEFYLSEKPDQKTAGQPAGDNYRDLYVIRKMKPTPSRYPRKAPLPAKSPLGNSVR